MRRFPRGPGPEVKVVKVGNPFVFSSMDTSGRDNAFRVYPVRSPY
jgi:hypothetical protein